MPRFQAVLFDFFGTLTHGARRGAAHLATAELLGCSPEALMEVLDSSFYERANGSLGDAEATMRWVCARLGVRPLQALRAAGADPALAECIDSLALASADAPDPIDEVASTRGTPQAPPRTPSRRKLER